MKEMLEVDLELLKQGREFENTLTAPFDEYDLIIKPFDEATGDGSAKILRLAFNGCVRC